MRIILAALTVLAALMAAPAHAALENLGPAPEFKLKALDGTELSKESLKGKVVVVDFWATWCGPCVQEIPGYIALQKKYAAQGVVIVGVSVDRGGPAKVQQFAEKRGMNYPVVIDAGELAEQFGGIEAIPTTFLIDRSGNIRHRKLGAMDHADYEKLLRQLL
jgi:peroxiredoxin